MKLLYLSTCDFKNEDSDGVCKKVKAQLKVFQQRGYEVDFIYIQSNSVLFLEKGEIRVIGKVGKIKKTPAYMKIYAKIKNKKYDCVYNRYGMADNFYNRVIKRLKKNGATIYIEVPSYPYEGERESGILYWIMYKWDEICRRELKKYVKKIITFTDYQEIIGIPTIRLINGYNVDGVQPIQSQNRDPKAIHLLVVTLMMRHHGFERLIEGLHEYVESGGKENILIHFVGDGVERSLYEELTCKYHLEDKIHFYGMMSGEALNQLYEKADFGICAMGLYKDNIYLASELKTREYLSKGLPLISGCQNEIFRDNEKWFYYKFSEDGTPIDMNRIVDAYHQICKTKTKQQVVKELRNFAKQTVDMPVTMEKLLKEIDCVEE